MPQSERPRIAYLCDLPPKDLHSYSGGNARICDSLRRHVGRVTVLDTGWGLAEPVRHAIRAMPLAIEMRLRWRAHLALARLIARNVRRQLRDGSYDVLFGAYAFHAIAGLRPPERIVTVYTSDATPTVYKRSEIGAAFGSYLSASRLLDPLILAAERRTFRSLDLLLWPTYWLKSRADALYGLSDAQSHVVPWGANVADPGVGSPPPHIGRGAPLRLLLLGRDWFAKGGPTAFDTMMALRATGVNCKLDVIGTTPPELHRNAHVVLHGALDKSKPADIARFETVLRGAHFLMQPSVESFGFAFCEAAAYGLPALCLRQGGIPVREGVNGHALPPGATPSDFAKLIEGYLDAPDRYANLRARSREEYNARLNWDAWGRRVADLIAEQRAIKERGSDA